MKIKKATQNGPKTNSRGKQPGKAAEAGATDQPINLRERYAFLFEGLEGQEALQTWLEEFLEALRKTQGLPKIEFLKNHKNLIQDLSTRFRPEAGFKEKNVGDDFVFIDQKTKRPYHVTPVSIEADILEEKPITYEEALVMAQWAALNPVWIRDGIELSGTRKDRALLTKAIKSVNKALPADQQLQIVAPGKMLARSVPPTSQIQPPSTQPENPPEPSPAPQPSPAQEPDPDVITNKVYRAVRRQVIRAKDASRSSIFEFLRQAGHEGNITTAEKKIYGRLKSEGVAQTVHGNKRVVLKQTFLERAKNTTAPLRHPNHTEKYGPPLTLNEIGTAARIAFKNMREPSYAERYGTPPGALEIISKALPRLKEAYKIIGEKLERWKYAHPIIPTIG